MDSKEDNLTDDLIAINKKIDEKFKADCNELPLMKWCEKFLNSNGIFVDVGAGIGSYSMILAKICGHVFAFESDKLFASVMVKNIHENNMSNITVYTVEKYKDCFNYNNINGSQIQFLRFEHDDLEFFINISKLLFDNNFPPFIVRITENKNIIDYIRALGYTVQCIYDFPGIFLADGNKRYIRQITIKNSDQDVSSSTQDTILEKHLI
jgi:hypothetical protein